MGCEEGTLYCVVPFRKVWGGAEQHKQSHLIHSPRGSENECIQYPRRSSIVCESTRSAFRNEIDGRDNGTV